MHLSARLMRTMTIAMEKFLPNPPATTSQLEMLSLDNVTELDSVERNFQMKPRPLAGNIGYIRDASRLDSLRIAPWLHSQAHEGTLGGTWITERPLTE